MVDKCDALEEEVKDLLDSFNDAVDDWEEYLGDAEACDSTQAELLDFIGTNITELSPFDLLEYLNLAAEHGSTCSSLNANARNSFQTLQGYHQLYMKAGDELIDCLHEYTKDLLDQE